MIPAPFFSAKKFCHISYEISWRPVKIYHKKWYHGMKKHLCFFWKKLKKFCHISYEISWRPGKIYHKKWYHGMKKHMCFFLKKVEKVVSYFIWNFMKASQNLSQKVNIFLGKKFENVLIIFRVFLIQNKNIAKFILNVKNALFGPNWRQKPIVWEWVEDNKSPMPLIIRFTR